jgi:hypothetical protein
VWCRLRRRCNSFDAAGRAAAGYFLLLAQEKVTKEKGNPEPPSLCRAGMHQCRGAHGCARAADAQRRLRVPTSKVTIVTEKRVRSLANMEEFMGEQIWRLSAEISGDFFLTKEEDLRSSEPPHPLVRKFQVLPAFDEHNKQTGDFTLRIEFAIESKDGEKPEAFIIADQARDIFDYYVNLLTFLSGNEIKTIKPVDLKYEYPEGGRFRSIMYESQIARLVPPVPLTHTALFQTPISSKLSRVLAFFAYGVREKDVVNSFAFFMSALDLVSTLYESGIKATRVCEKCGYEKEIEAGAAQRIRYVLTDVAAYSEADFKAIWNLRNSIFHGYFSPSSQNIREIHRNREIARIAVMRAIKRLIGLNNRDIPLESPTQWFADPILDVEYTSNP